MTFILVFLWFLSALMIATAVTRLYEKASEDIKQIFRGCGGKKGLFFIIFFGIFVLVAIVGSVLHPSAMVSGSKVRSRGGISSEPIVKPLQTIRPTETTGTVITSEPPPIAKKPDTSIAPVENEGKVRQPEPPPEIIRPGDKKR